jgi:hypothetical protein
MVIAALAMTALLLFAALAIDVGLTYSSRTQSQNANDSAVLAAGDKMIFQDPMTTDAAVVDKPAAIAAGTQYAGLNGTVNSGSMKVRPGDFEFGEWDPINRTLDTSVNQSNPDLITGVRLTVAMDNSAGANQRSPSFLSQFLGRNGMDVVNQATAYKGFKGEFAASDFNLPIAVDSCELSNNGGCGNDFCTHIPSGTCNLESPQSDSSRMICGVFQNTGDQNLCWTAFDPSSAAINKKKLTDIIDNGNPGPVEAGDKVYLDNGDKTSTLDYLRDKFYGCGSFPSRRNSPTIICTARPGRPTRGSSSCPSSSARTPRTAQAAIRC